MNGFKEKVVREIIRLGKKNHSLRMPALAVAALFLVAYHSIRNFFLQFRYHPVRQRILVGILVLSLLAGQIGIVNVSAESEDGTTIISDFLELPGDVENSSEDTGEDADDRETGDADAETEEPSDGEETDTEDKDGDTEETDGSGQDGTGQETVAEDTDTEETPGGEESGQEETDTDTEETETPGGEESGQEETDTDTEETETPEGEESGQEEADTDTEETETPEGEESGQEAAEESGNTEENTDTDKEEQDTQPEGTAVEDTATEETVMTENADDAGDKDNGDSAPSDEAGNAEITQETYNITMLEYQAENAHTHKVCVNSSHANCTHDEDIEFEPFPENEEILRGKSYYLTKSIELVENDRLFVEKGVTNICLNGFSIKKEGGEIIDINEIDGQSAELNICDCTGNGKIENTSEDNCYPCISVIDESVLNIYGGTVDGGAQANGIRVANTSEGEGQGGVANIYGGVIKTKGKSAIWLAAPDTSLSVYGGEISSSGYCAISADGERSTVSICGGKVTGSAANFGTLFISGEGACVTISGGQVIGKNYTAVSCQNGTLKITGGEVKSEGSTGNTVYNADTLVLSGGNVSCGGYYGIYNYKNGKITISGGEINSAGSAIYNREDGEVKIEGGNISSDNYSGIYNYGTLIMTDGEMTGKGSCAIENRGNADLKNGKITGKGTYAICNYSGGKVELSGVNIEADGSAIYNYGITEIISGNISSSKYYAVYNEGSLKTSGGKITAGDKLLWNKPKGIAEIDGGELISETEDCVYNQGSLTVSGGNIISEGNNIHCVNNYGTACISGGVFGAGAKGDARYITNNIGGTLELSGAPQLNNTSIWLQDDNNITIVGGLTNTDPYKVYIKSSVPRIITKGWNTYMSGKDPFDYFESPYIPCTVAESGGEALLRRIVITFNANGGTCETSNTSVNDNGKALSFPETTRENYSFDGWFTAAENGEKVTVDTVFNDDTTVYAHWMCSGHIWSDTYEKDNDQHWKVCTKCNETDIKVDHIWDGGTVTTPATWETEGVRTYTCTVCSATRNESIEMLPHTHTYSDKWTSNDTSHWYAAACGHDVVSGQAAHSEDNGTVTVPATYENAGVKTFACTVCGYVMRTETIPQLEEEHIHNFSPDWTHDSTNHWHECDCGGKSELANHISSDWIVQTPATTDLEGVQIKNCTICGIELDRNSIDKLPNGGDSGSTPQPEGTPTPQPEGTPTPQPEGTPTPQPEGTPTPQPEGTPTPQPEGTPTPQPEGTPTPQPEGLPEQSAEPENTAMQTAPAKVADGRIAISGGTVETGNITQNSETTTLLEVGDGTVIVTVVCEDEGYAAGVKDTVAVANAVLMPEQIQLVNDGETIEVRIDVKDITETVPGQDKEVIESGLTEYRKEIPELTLGMYVDISMFIRIGEGDWDAVTATKEPIEVIIGIPEELQKEGREFYIIRSHEGEYTLLNDMDNDSDTITISTDMFSAYAIAYQQTDSDNAQGENTKCGLCHICPTFLGICCFIWLAIIIAVIIIVIIVLRRKKDEEEHQAAEK